MPSLEPDHLPARSLNDAKKIFLLTNIGCLGMSNIGRNPLNRLYSSFLVLSTPCTPTHWTAGLENMDTIVLGFSDPVLQIINCKDPDLDLDLASSCSSTLSCYQIYTNKSLPLVTNRFYWKLLWKLLTIIWCITNCAYYTAVGWTVFTTQSGSRINAWFPTPSCGLFLICRGKLNSQKLRKICTYIQRKNS